MDITFHPMNEATARRIAAWRYDASYSMYDPSEDDIAHFIDPANAYFAITDEHGTLIAYRCFGADAQVPGGDYRADALDPGGGMRPDLTGRGMGLTLMKAGLDFGQALFAPRAFRVTVAGWNGRALRVCEKAGFQPVQHFVHARDGRPFVVLVRWA